jgi:peptide/nickel transport system substrate-binding protein
MTHIAFSNRRDFLAAAASLAAVSFPLSNAAAAGPQRRGGTLRVSISQAVNKLNPLQARVTPEYLVAELLYSGLTRIGPSMAPEADLAESWSSSSDLTQWTFKLRQGVVFHDGSPCTSGDVVASFQAILDAKTASPGRQNIGPIKSVAAPDKATVVFTLSTPYADFPVALAFPNAKVVPAAIVEKGMDRLSREAVGTGPFKLVTFEPERIVTVVRNDKYYDKVRPYLDKIEVRVYPDPTAEGSALIAGDTDLMALVQPTEFARLKASNNIDALKLPSGVFCNINLGCNQKPFNDVRVRRALALTVDRQAMIDFVAEGYGTVAYDNPINSSYQFFKDVRHRKQDITQAKKLLAEAGYDKGLNLTLIASDNPSIRTQMAVALKEMAKPAGFNIDVQTMPHATYLEQVWKKGNFYVGFYNMQPTVDSIFSLLYTSNASWNETHWNNATFDKLVADARATSDVSKRAELYAEAQRLMSDEVPSIIPVFFDLLRAKRKYVEGYQVNPRGLVYRLDYVSLGDGAPKRS